MKFIATQVLIIKSSKAMMHGSHYNVATHVGMASITMSKKLLCCNSYCHSYPLEPSSNVASSQLCMRNHDYFIRLSQFYYILSRLHSRLRAWLPSHAKFQLFCSCIIKDESPYYNINLGVWWCGLIF